MIKYFIAPPEGVGFEIGFDRKTSGSSGFDLHANIGVPRTISPGRRFSIRTGIHLAMSPGIEAHVRPRSGLTRDHGIVCAFGSIDSDYRGEIAVVLFNHGDVDYKVLPGDRVAQLVFAPVLPDFVGTHGWGNFKSVFEMTPNRVGSLDELGTTDRGASGFGSSGR